MKLKDGIIITDAGGFYVAVDAGMTGDRFHGMIKMNETAVFVAHQLEKATTEEAIVEAMLGEYDVDADTAAKSVAKVIVSFREAGIIEE